MANEVDWQRLDKQRFFVYGAGIFTSLTACLFPLTVVKTRMMALEGAPSGLSGAVFTARTVVQHDGFRGLYKGFGTVLCGLIPARVLYLGTLEYSKAAVLPLLQQYTQLPDTAAAGAANFIGGGLGSLAGQLVVVPIDVVSQRLMLIGGGPPNGAPATAAAASGGAASRAAASSSSSRHKPSGLHLARQIVARDGFRGLYRGFGASVATFVPSSSIWWASYGAWQTAIWHQVDKFGEGSSSASVHHPESQVLAVQAVSGVLTGMTSATLTNPLDVVKTRLQTRHVAEGSVRPTWLGVARALVQQEGVVGFSRGLAPRMVSTAVWGTAMVTTYEFLKRLCRLPDPEDRPKAPSTGLINEDAVVEAVPSKFRRQPPS